MPSAGRAIRPLWKLEAALKCRLCRKGRYAPPVHMIKLTETRKITPYVFKGPGVTASTSKKLKPHIVQYSCPGRSPVSPESTQNVCQ